jgi:predicted RNA binding protein with dsRBD fold (UPF0201 family)
MKLLGTIDLHVRGERVLRQPGFWDRVKKRFGGEPDLSTDQVRAALEAAALVDAARRALQRLGVNNAISLVIDDQVLFQDREGKADDLGDLFLAFHEHASVFGKEFQLLRLASEHEEAGLHYVIEVVARGTHPESEAAGKIVVSGRIRDFEPRRGEDAEAYRRRVEPLTTQASLYEAHRRQFDSFVARVAEAVRVTLPEARVEVRSADAMIVRPSTRPAPRRRAEDDSPTSPRYDPHEMYYPNPYGGLLGALMWTSIFSMAMPPPITVINQQGDPVGTTQDVDPDPDAADAAADADADADVGADAADADMDAGDFGGGDFGDW